MDRTKCETELDTVISIPIARSNKLLGLVGFIAALINWIVGVGYEVFIFSTPSTKPHKLETLYFHHFLLDLSVLFCLYIGIRSRFEKQTWYLSRDNFKCGFDLLGYKRVKKYHGNVWIIKAAPGTAATEWRLKPGGPKVPGEMFPPNYVAVADDAIKMGEQVALVTGWPLSIVWELQELRRTKEANL